MNKNSVTFCTFCCAKDAHLLHAPGQLKKQIDSNQYDFDEIIVVHQKCNPSDYENPYFWDCEHKNLNSYVIESDNEIDKLLETFGIDLTKKQYESSTDSHHTWKPHVVNHLKGISVSQSEYTLFADADCIMKNPTNWIDFAIKKMKSDSSIFICSPNDGEPERLTLRMSQQMFLVKTEDFRNMDFNQPGFSGDVRELDTMPQYAAMLEGRMQFYCQTVGKYRYVCPPEYRYWHCNKFDENGHYEYDWSKY